MCVCVRVLECVGVIVYMCSRANFRICYASLVSQVCQRWLWLHHRKVPRWGTASTCIWTRRSILRQLYLHSILSRTLVHNIHVPSLLLTMHEHWASSGCGCWTACYISLCVCVCVCACVRVCVCVCARVRVRARVQTASRKLVSGNTINYWS